MPEQKPISSIISRSYSVRILIRCASSSLPRPSNQAMRLGQFRREWRSDGALDLVHRSDELFAGINRDRIAALPACRRSAVQTA